MAGLSLKSFGVLIGIGSEMEHTWSPNGTVNQVDTSGDYSNLGVNLSLVNNGTPSSLSEKIEEENYYSADEGPMPSDVNPTSLQAGSRRSIQRAATSRSHTNQISSK